MHEISVRREGEQVVIEVQANAFLHHMVRNFVGSLLPVGRGEQPEAWRRLWRALKPGGVAYASYKLGQGERVDEAGRAFTDANEDRLSEWLNPLQGIARVEIWQTTDQRPGQAQTWLNALIHRHPTER